MRHLGALRKYFWKYQYRLSIGIFFIFISNYFGVLAPQITGYIVDYVQRNLQLAGYQPPNKNANYDVLVQAFIDKLENYQLTIPGIVAVSGITILVLALLRGLFMFFMRQTIIVMSRHIEYDQKNEVYTHYQLLDVNFYKQNSIGDLMSRMAEDVSRVRMFTGPAVMYLINLIALISMTVFFMIKRSPTLTLYVLAPLPILAIIIYTVNTIIHKKSEQLQGALAALTVNAQQSYSGIRVIKSFVQERAMFRFFEDNSERYRKEAVNLAKVEALYFPSMSLFIGLSTLLTILFGGLSYINGAGNIGLDTIVEFVIYINMLTFPVSAIGWTASMIQRAATSQKRLNEFLHTKPSIQDPIDSIKPKIQGNIQLENVNFIYPNTGIHALKDFNLTIEAGEKVAIVGKTGSGKTTIAQLLLRLYDATSGSVLIDGHPINTLDLNEFRSQISYVPQDGFLFSDTIGKNISFGAPLANQENIEIAAKQAVVDLDILRLPLQYNTIVGERGVTLSGGQKQRVSIARALLKQASVLILDDSLSAVDAKTEKEIFHHIETFMQGRTSIIITHKITSLSNFDRIIVLDNGRIIESGTHKDLLASKGEYYEMYYRQQIKREDNNL